MEQQKPGGLFMKACIAVSALWLLGAAAVVVYFHAVGRPLDKVVAAFLFSPGIGELGFSSLVKAAQERGGGAEIAALRAQLDDLKPKPGKRTAAPDTQEAKAPAPAERKQARAMLEQMLPCLVTDAEREYGPGAGALKLSSVLEKVYVRLPDAYKPIFTPDQLGGMVDKALTIAKELWQRNPSLIARTGTQGFP